MKEKGVSSAVIMAIVAVIVVVAVGIGLYVATRGEEGEEGGLGGRGTPPSAMITVTATISGNDITLTISHEGGDDLVLSDLEIKADNSATTMVTKKGTDLTGIAGTTFNVGESGTVTYTSTGIAAGNTITVFVIHTPSKQKIFSSSSVVVR